MFPREQVILPSSLISADIGPISSETVHWAFLKAQIPHFIGFYLIHCFPFLKKCWYFLNLAAIFFSETHPRYVWPKKCRTFPLSKESSLIRYLDERWVEGHQFLKARIFESKQLPDNLELIFSLLLNKPAF